MSPLETCVDSHSAISSLESQFGPRPFGLPDGLTHGPSGLAAVLANLSPRQAKAAGLLTSGTYGRLGMTSFDAQSRALSRSLENRLRERTAVLGSPLFALTWKVHPMPLGGAIFALRASGRRTSDSACTSWPTPSASVIEAKSVPPIMAGRKPTDPQIGLADVAVHLTGWATPKVSDGRGSPYLSQPGDRRVELRKQVGWPTPTVSDSVRMPGANFTTPNITLNHAAAWATPMAQDAEAAGGPQQTCLTNQATGRYSETMPGGSCPTPAARDWKGATLERWGTNSRPLNEQVRLVSGLDASGSPAATEKRGQLNPELPRWLMGLSAAWSSCAPTETRSSPRKRRNS